MSLSWQFLLKQAKKVFAIDEVFSVGKLMKKAHSVEPLHSCTAVGRIIERRENAKRARKKPTLVVEEREDRPGYVEHFFDTDGEPFGR